MMLGLTLSLSRGALIGLVAGLLAFLFFGGPGKLADLSERIQDFLRVFMIDLHN